MTNSQIANITTDWNQTLSDILGRIRDGHEKPGYTMLPYDLIARACAWHRIRTVNAKNFSPFSSIADTDLGNSVISADREKAKAIMSYYGQKLMFLVLKGITLTPFRQDLNQLVTSEKEVSVEKFAPMSYRLPEFYHADLLFDEIKSDLVTEIDRSTRALITARARDAYLTLHKIGKIHRASRRENLTQYWMRDQNNIGYLISIANTNPLLHLWDEKYDKSEQLCINGIVSINRRDFVDYFILSKWTLLTP